MGDVFDCPVGHTPSPPEANHGVCLKREFKLTNHLADPENSHRILTCSVRAREIKEYSHTSERNDSSLSETKDESLTREPIPTTSGN